ncbi:hypothetical protein NOR_00346 [Metarhizium rileyi]|uniref:Uncharacterized protein n=1 Tax=Metarhizium rileyi (strain RCEF 4871) TaxID=1649241 RepID=A0A167KHS1_METRR|nr:hypothetical protein NOR_00346 [Metarhizium rileyi RCEF 4871]
MKLTRLALVVVSCALLLLSYPSTCAATPFRNRKWTSPSKHWPKLKLKFKPNIWRGRPTFKVSIVAAPPRAPQFTTPKPFRTGRAKSPSHGIGHVMPAPGEGHATLSHDRTPLQGSSRTPPPVNRKPRQTPGIDPYKRKGGVSEPEDADGPQPGSQQHDRETVHAVPVHEPGWESDEPEGQTDDTTDEKADWEESDEPEDNTNDTTYETVDGENTKDLFREQDGILYDGVGEPLPTTSKDQSDTNNPNSRWHKEDTETGDRQSWKLDNGKEVFTKKPLDPGPEVARDPEAIYEQEQDEKPSRYGRQVPTPEDQVVAISDPDSKQVVPQRFQGRKKLA